MSRQIATTRPLAVLAGASALLLAALLEAFFLGEYATEVVAATLLGFPAVWLLVRVALRMKRRVKLDVFSPLVAFPLAYVLWFGLGSLTFLWESDPPRHLYFALGLLAYLAGALVTHRKGESVREACRPPERIPWGARRFRLTTLVFFLLMTGSYLVIAAQIGIPAIHADVDLRREALGSHHYLVAVLLSSATTLMLFSAADLWTVNRVLAPFLSGGILGLAVLMLGSFGNRGFLIVPVLTLLILRHYWRRHIPAGGLAIILAVVFLASVAYDYARVRALRNEWRDSAWSELLYSSAAFILHTNLSNFRDIVQAIPSEVPYQRGYLTFGAMLQILPGHHESSDEFFKRILANDFVGGGQPGSVLAPFYGDFGLGGILAGMLLLGAFSGKAYEWMRKNPTLFRILLYSWLAQTALFSLYGALVTYIITLWLPFMWWLLQRWMCTQEAEEARNQQAVRSLQPV